MAKNTSPEPANPGHRQRLRDRFLNNEKGSRSDEALLELLLTYTIPQKDVRPLVVHLLAKYGDLTSVLNASVDELSQIKGVKDYSATLIKLVDVIRQRRSVESVFEKEQDRTEQLTIYDAVQIESPEKLTDSESVAERKRIKQHEAGIFGKAVLTETVEMLPLLPDTDSLIEIRDFLRANLHFSAEQTRQRNASYIIKRMFRYGYADKPLRSFAKAHPNSQELKEVCFYRFMVAEPLELDIVEELLIPNIGAGNIPRERIRVALKERFPESRSIPDGTSAIVDALKACGIARADTKTVSFAYRDIPLASFAFILHSEYPEPGMYSINDLENNRLIKAMLWNPERLSFTLYELRNQGIISKISEIDGIRQFSTKYCLSEAVAIIIGS